jgi:hypothetical protein
MLNDLLNRKKNELNAKSLKLEYQESYTNSLQDDIDKTYYTSGDKKNWNKLVYEAPD